MKAIAFTLACLVTASAGAVEFDTTIPMTSHGAATYYVKGELQGFGDVDLMVDTGSGYLTINEHTLAVLKKKKRVRYLRDLHGILANGSTLVVPVYSVSALKIGACSLRNVEAAVFPGKTRLILGLSALNKAAPFIFSVKPAQLVLSNCKGDSNA